MPVMSDSFLSEVLRAAREGLAAAEQACDTCECEDSDCLHFTAVWEAEESVELARCALAESTEPREWKLYEEGHHYSTIQAGTMDEALDAAREGVDPANYPGVDGDGLRETIWVSVRVKCEATGEEDSASVECDPEPPSCTAGQEHKWRAPHRLVGGLKDNPGIQGHGGGITIQEVCITCGCGKLVDTWATNPETGEQGLTSVSYQVGKYSDVLQDAPKEIQAYH